ncbi:hypothetical protein U1Q18_004801 [Sarracenia purpurea var. burkii]
MLPANSILLLGLIIVSCLVLRFLFKTSVLHIIKKWWRLFGDRFHVHQFYKVPQFNKHMQENQLYRQVLTYLNSLPSVEDSDFANLFSGCKSNEITLALDPNQTIVDTFLSARVSWTNEKCETAFRTLANSYLGLKEHKLFPQVEEVFQSGASLSPAEIGEIMISNRTSPTRALKTVISALQTSAERRTSARVAQRLTESMSGRSSEESGESAPLFPRENVHSMKEGRKLYGLLRKSGRKSSMDLESVEKENTRH